MEKVLYYSPASLPGRAAAVLVQMGVRLRRVTAKEAHQTVGFLAGVPGCAPASGPVAQPLTGTVPAIVFYGMSDQKLNTVLAALQRAGVPRSTLKAVVTGENRNWTFARLYGELQSEHQALS